MWRSLVVLFGLYSVFSLDAANYTRQEAVRNEIQQATGYDSNRVLREIDLCYVIDNMDGKYSDASEDAFWKEYNRCKDCNAFSFGKALEDYKNAIEQRNITELDKLVQLHSGDYVFDYSRCPDVNNVYSSKPIPDLKNLEVIPLLELARRLKNDVALDFLISKKISVNATLNGKPIIEVWKEEGYIEGVQKLINAGVSLPTPKVCETMRVSHDEDVHGTGVVDNEVITDSDADLSVEHSDENWGLSHDEDVPGTGAVGNDKTN